ncbi:TRAP-type C4-dicarboxylate transport system, small permease component [Salinihabitans flavidus]|uniref:TRAP transporter small permease protein n=1 Tax=Salinihabitans flavidus TaxID=569882 RepID=A0A1H8MJK8_9RHOB|nr:TRAP transporter small permease subunit [Salinihabitans flavidus]SEO17612.1 TRAP-type C4-dicarboxylate transport system, small permease component [Salinihabitans flavidus]
MIRLADHVDRISAALNRIALWGAVLALLVMLLSASWQVVARYVLDAPPIWTEELSRRGMVWAGMLGASCAFRAGADPTLFPAMRHYRGGTGMALSLIRGAGVVIFATPVIWYSVFNARMDPARGFLGRSLNRQAEMLEIPMIFFTAAVPVAFVLIVIHMTAGILVRASGRLPANETPREDIET